MEAVCYARPTARAGEHVREWRLGAHGSRRDPAGEMKPVRLGWGGLSVRAGRQRLRFLSIQRSLQTASSMA